MLRTIAIIAPMIDEMQANINFNLRLKQNNRQLTLTALHELAKNGFNFKKLSRGYSYDRNTIPAAGYYLTGLLRKNGYNTVLFNKVDNETLEEIESENPFAICVSSSMVLETESLVQIVKQIRQVMMECFIIIGGVYVWKHYYISRTFTNSLRVNNDQMGTSHRQHLVFDKGDFKVDADLFVVSPHGSQPLLMVLKELERGKKVNFKEIPNLAIPDGQNGFIFTPRWDENIDYNNDYTNWDLIDELPMRIPIRTSIGCPYRCRFCDFCLLYPKISLRTKESLMSELIKIKSNLSGNNSSILHFTDDNVFINQNRVNDVCTAIIESGLIDSGLSGWISFMRGSSINPSNIRLIKQSRLLLSMIGVESGDSQQLKRMKKNQKLNEIKKGIELLDQAGICVLMTFLVGFPGETSETIENTAQFINSLSIGTSSSNYQLYPLYIFPLSDLSTPETREKWNISGLLDTWSHYTMNSGEAIKYCYTLFKKIPYVPYHYAEESNFFNRLINNDKRLRLFNLRQMLTIQFLEDAPWEKIVETFADISQTMGFPKIYLGNHSREEIVVPKLKQA